MLPSKDVGIVEADDRLEESDETDERRELIVLLWEPMWP